ncbi:MAG: hypothetical protein AABY00_03625 [Nanoarchaeota archaeon]
MVYAIVSLLALIFLKWREGSTGIDITIISILVNLYTIAIMIWSIVAWAIFVKNKVPKKTLVLPIYYLAMTLLTIILVVYSISAGQEIDTLSWGWMVVSLASSLFEAIYSSYILKVVK